MKKIQFKTGDRVGYVEEYEDEYGGRFARKGLRYDEYGDYEPIYGTITDELSDNRFLVKWDKSSWLSDSDPFDKDDLNPENELKEKYSDLEKAFKAAQKQAESKIKAAAKSIFAAQKIAKKAGFHLNELGKIIEPLERAMDQSGWQTSSWHCPGF